MVVTLSACTNTNKWKKKKRSERAVNLLSSAKEPVVGVVAIDLGAQRLQTTATYAQG